MKHYHFIGIGGSGMRPLALLAMAKGCWVSGSDIQKSPLTEALIKQGASISFQHASENVCNPDYVVYSSAVGFDNPELIVAREQNVPVLKRAQLLAELTADAQTAITVAGAHGKTTTSAMAAHLLIHSGLEPTTFVGGIVHQGTCNSHLGDGRHFVTEVDESDGSFLYFHPFYSIITNIDFEHMDYYGSWDRLLKAYQQFIEQTHSDGSVIAYGDDRPLNKLLNKTKKTFLTYGLNEPNDLRAANIILEGFSSTFDCFFKDKKIGKMTLNVPGRHNILNALAVIALGLKLEIPFSTIEKSLRTYQGVQRRFQLKGISHDVTVIDDYGHHPTEIRATLQTAQNFKKERLITVFQPHRYSRTQLMMKELAESLILSDHLILTDIYGAGEEPIPEVSSPALLEKIKDLSDHDTIYLTKGQIVPHLCRIASAGDLILTLGAGDIDQVGEAFLKGFQHESSKSKEPVETIMKISK